MMINLQKKEIASAADIQLLAEAFTQKILKHPYLAAIYQKLTPNDWKNHVFNMTKFWNAVLLKSETFIGHPFILHAFLPAQQAQAREWVCLFHEAVEEHFTGPTAATAKAFADKVSRIFGRPA